MEFLDARRLTGPNVLCSRAGAVLDVSCSDAEADLLVPYCEARLKEMLAAIGWDDETVCHARLAGGASVALTGPIDALYAASAICEWAWACCDAAWNGAAAPDFELSVAEIRAAIAAEANPSLLALREAAAAHDVSLLWDDDYVSVGQGCGSATWPARELPDPAAVPWQAVHDIPAGIVTGTNGKTTTARIAQHLLKTAGRTVGLSCTDWVAVNDRIVDRDDWSGPGGARMVLRQPEVDAAILETARGGLLRRGLGVERADAALITNIAEDHLGDFGSRNLDELLNIKWVVSHAVAAAGALILNADDPRLVARAATFPGRIVWFSLDADSPVVAAHTAAGGRAFVDSGGDLVRLDGATRTALCRAADVPITLGGAAAHNVANALAAAALTEQLGLSLGDIGRGLTTMSQAANPGRSNLYAVGDYRVLVDFAHNPEAMQALFNMASAIPARRRALCFAQAGDRTDRQIRELARRAWAIGLDLVCIAELADYRRGRAEGEVYGILLDELRSAGASAEQVRYFATESESFDAALDWAGAGDLVVLLDLGRKSDVHGRIEARQRG